MIQLFKAGRVEHMFILRGTANIAPGGVVELYHGSQRRLGRVGSSLWRIRGRKAIGRSSICIRCRASRYARTRHTVKAQPYSLLHHTTYPLPPHPLPSPHYTHRRSTLRSQSSTTLLPPRWTPYLQGSPHASYRPRPGCRRYERHQRSY